jgi:hypothetical protein
MEYDTSSSELDILLVCLRLFVCCPISKQSARWWAPRRLVVCCLACSGGAWRLGWWSGGVLVVFCLTCFLAGSELLPGGFLIPSKN